MFSCCSSKHLANADAWDVAERHDGLNTICITDSHQDYHQRLTTHISKSGVPISITWSADKSSRIGTGIITIRLHKANLSGPLNDQYDRDVVIRMSPSNDTRKLWVCKLISSKQSLSVEDCDLVVDWQVVCSREHQYAFFTDLHSYEMC